MDPWLSAAADALAAETNLPRERLELSPDQIRTLLDLAGVAAHDSGQRTNAPLLCYLAGIAVASSGHSTGDVAAAVPRTT